MKKVKLLLVGFLLVPTLAFAQKSIKGTVTDESGEPLVGVTVQVAGTDEYAVTDLDGQYTVLANDGDKLIVSFIGMKTRAVKVAGNAPMLITLLNDTVLLEETVVVGYGTQKKVSVTGSVVAMAGKELEKLPMDNVSNMLAGRLPGVVAIQNSGMPGEGSSVMVRGSSTTSSGGNTPIYIVDGIQRDMIDLLSPDEIESITVLKDAASAAIYGVQGGSGVILITTKRGSEAKPSITFKSSVNISRNTNFPEFLNALDYMRWHNLARELDGQTPLYTDEIMLQVKNGENGYGITDWFGEVFSGKGLTQNYEVSTSGGTKTAKYYVAGGYTNNEGIVRNISYDKFFLRSNLDFKINEWLRMGVNMSGYRTETDRPSSDVSAGNSGSSTSVFWQATLAKPIYPLKYESGLYSSATTLKGNMNPVASLTESGFNRNRNMLFNSSVRFDVNVPQVKGLTGYFLVGYDYNQTRAKSWRLPFQLQKPDGSVVVNTVQQRSVLMESESENSKLAVQGSIQYENTFAGKHYLRAQLVYDQLQREASSLAAGKMNYEMLDIPELNLGPDEEVVPKSVTGTSAKFARIGAVARLNYAYADKYLVEALVRADASVKFAKNNRWGYFPAVSLGWRLTEEDWMADTRSWLDNLKIRGSFGITGNDRIADWLYMRSVSLVKNAYVIDGELVNALATGSVPSYDISWEKQRTYNVGFDATLWDGMLYAEFDYFYKYSWDILQSMSASMPPSLGGNYPSTINKGKVDNRGFELTLGHRNRVSDDFSYEISGNVSYNRNRILQFNDQVNIPDYQKKTGHSVGSLIGLVAEGLYQDEEDLANSPKYKGDAKVGDIKYKDINGDGIITYDADACVISDGYIPKWNFGINLGARWKDFDFSLLLQGAADFEVALQGYYGSGTQSTTNFTKPFAADGNTPYFLVANSWTPDNTDAEFPRLTTRTSIAQNAYFSSLWLRRGDYIRVKNAQIGYNVPKIVTDKIGIAGLRIYVSGNNLLTLSQLTKYGLDPEAPSVSNGYYPQQRVFSAGINLTF